MKINTIKINNFKGIVNLEYSPRNKLAVLCAPNGAGKTSFIEALRFGLTGDAPDNCINDMAEETEVELLFSKDDLSFSRSRHITKPSKVKVRGKSTTAKNLDIVLQDTIGLSKETLKITTSQELLTSMKPDALGSFLMEYVPEELDFDTVVKYIPGITPEAKEALALYLPPMPEKFGLSRVEETYKLVFEARSFAKKDKQNRDAQVNLMTLDPPSRSLEKIEEEEKSVFVQEGIQASAKAAMNLYNSAIKVRENAEKSIADLQRQIDANTASKPRESELHDILSRKNKALENISNANKIIAMIETNLETFERTLETLHKPVCPISEMLVCTTDKTAIKEEITELINANKEGITIQEAIISEEKRKLEDLAKKEAEWNENNKCYTQKVTLTNRLAVERKNLPSVPVKPASVTVIDFEGKKADLKREKNYTIAYERNQQLLRESEALAKKYDMLNSLCKALEPKGVVMSGITSSYLGIFESVINKRADDLGAGYKVEFIAENGVNYTIKTPASTVFRPYADLSHGEQLIATFLLIDLLNSLCGTRIMLLDDLNHLDANNFNILLSLLQSKTLQDDYDHIFVCVAHTPEIEKILVGASDIDKIY